MRDPSCFEEEDVGQLVGKREEGFSFRISRSDDTSARISETSCLMVLNSLRRVEQLDMLQEGKVAVAAWGV